MSIALPWFGHTPKWLLQYWSFNPRWSKHSESLARQLLIKVTLAHQSNPPLNKNFRLPQMILNHAQEVLSPKRGLKQSNKALYVGIVRGRPPLEHLTVAKFQKLIRETTEQRPKPRFFLFVPNSDPWILMRAAFKKHLYDMRRMQYRSVTWYFQGQ